MSLTDWEDSQESVNKILLLALPKDREMYKKMFSNTINNPKVDSRKKAFQISMIVKMLATKENFHRLMKESRKDTLQVLAVVSLSVGPNELKMLYESVHSKLKKKAGR